MPTLSQEYQMLNIKYLCPLSSAFSSTYICNLGLLPHPQSPTSLKAQLVAVVNLCLKLENHISSTLFELVFLIKTFQCNLERINESADMQAKVRSVNANIPQPPSI